MVGVQVDKYQNTNVAYALGDVCGIVELTPMAIAAGRRLADRYTVLQCTYVLLQCTYVLLQCTYVLLQCTYVLLQCTYVLYYGDH